MNIFIINLVSMIELKYFFKLGLKILLLAFPIVIINVIYLNSSSWKNKDGVLKFKNVSESIKIANLGSSHAVEGIDYDIPELENVVCFNFGMHQQTLNYDYFVFDQFKDKMQENSVLIISLSSFETNGIPDFSKNKTSIYRYYKFLDYKYFDFSNKETLKHFIYFRYLPIFTCNPISEIYKSFKTTELNEPFNTRDYSKFSDEKKKNDLVLFRNGWKGLFPPSVDGIDFNKKYIKAIVDICKEKKIKPVLITCPITKDVFVSLKDNPIYFDLNSFVDILKVDIPDLEYFNYIDLFLNDDEYFYDNNHLNLTGRKIFTKQLIKDLKEKNILDM